MNQKRDLRGQRGQGLTEYAIILVLVVIAIIGMAVTFGDDIRQMLENRSTTNAVQPGAASGAKTPPAAGGTTGSAR